MKTAQQRWLWLLVGILLVSAALRTQDLHRLVDGVHYDEAYYAVDAQSLIDQPRFTPFFPENFGRESLWMYTLVPSLVVFGGSAFPLRVTALLVGWVTVASVYRLGRELIGIRAAVWAAAALGMLFWHVLASHQAFRAHLYPLVGTWAFAALWWAWRTRILRAWMIAGGLFGLLAYTYIAARAWLAAGVIISAGMLIAARARVGKRQVSTGVALTLLVASAAALPLILHLMTMSQAAGLRVEQVAINGVQQLADNLLEWGRALVARGSTDVAYNLPGRPILDAPLLILAGAGALALLVQVRRHRCAPAFIGLLIIASLAPALLTADTLKPLRAVGLVIPLALVMGAGAAVLHTGLVRIMTARRLPQPRLSALVPLLLLTWAGINSSRDFADWVRSPDLYLPMEQHIYRGIDVMAAVAPPRASVYFTPFTPDHPVIRLRMHMLADHAISAFKPQECLRFPAAAAGYYFALTLFVPDFAQRLTPWADVSEVFREAEGRYAVYQAAARPGVFASERVAFAGRLQIALTEALPSTVGSGDALTFAVAVRAQTTLDRPYTLFAHIYGDPTPYEGGALWAQADVPLCPGSPPPTWRTDEWIVQTITLSLPSDLPPGSYSLALGLYDTRSGERLSLSAPNTGLSYAIMDVLAVSR